MLDNLLISRSSLKNGVDRSQESPLDGPMIHDAHQELGFSQRCLLKALNR
jgi:hypothetical protein